MVPSFDGGRSSGLTGVLLMSARVAASSGAVSYTHLTLPTILRV